MHLFDGADDSGMVSSELSAIVCDTQLISVSATDGTQCGTRLVHGASINGIMWLMSHMSLMTSTNYADNHSQSQSTISTTNDLLCQQVGSNSVTPRMLTTTF